MFVANHYSVVEEIIRNNSFHQQAISVDQAGMNNKNLIQKQLCDHLTTKTYNILHFSQGHFAKINTIPLCTCYGIRSQVYICLYENFNILQAIVYHTQNPRETNIAETAAQFDHQKELLTLTERRLFIGNHNSNDVEIILNISFHIESVE